MEAALHGACVGSASSRIELPSLRGALHGPTSAVCAQVSYHGLPTLKTLKTLNTFTLILKVELMDHLHRLPGSKELPTIPYRGTPYTPNEEENFCDCLARSFREFRNGGTPNETAIVRFQTLLYFGLLNEVLGPISHEQYIRHTDCGQTFITTKQLEKDAKGRFQVWKRLSRDDGKAEILRVLRCIKTVRDFTYKAESRSFVSNLLGEDFIFAVEVLGASLGDPIYQFAKRGRLLPSEEKSTGLFWLAQNPWASTKMLENGWCPYEVERFSQLLSPLTQIAALGLQSSSAQLNHSVCKPFACEANNVTGEYIPAHTEDCVSISGSRCNFMDSCVSGVIEILKDGGLPLIEIRRDSAGTPRTRVVRYWKGRRFVAISHVWSDGLGNKKENKMLPCQLARIWGHARNLIRDNSQISLSYDNRVNAFALGAAYLTHITRNVVDMDWGAVNIWIDTLCVPLEPRDMRNLAIKRMRDAYDKGEYLVSGK